MKKETQNVVNNNVILNLIQDLQRFSLQLVNSMRGRYPAGRPIKYGMTALFMPPHLPCGHPLPQGARETTGGFTLIELLVVVLIIGILAAVAVPQYQKAVAKSRAVEAISMLKALTKAQNVYYLANGTWAEGVNEMKKLDIVVPENQLTGWTGTDAAHPNTYMYSCLNTACIANAANKNMPMFQVTFPEVPPFVTHKNFMECSTYGGKTKIAQEICESLGKQSHYNYWVIN